MKLSTKLIISLTCVVAILFSIFGVFMIFQNFNHALDSTIKQNRNQHLVERYVVETNILHTIVSGNNLTDDNLIAYGASLSEYLQNDQKLAILLSDKKAIYSNLPNDVSSLDIEYILDSNTDYYVIKHIDEKQQMLTASKIEINNNEIFVLSMYDISHVFTDRDRQLFNFLILDIVAVITIAIVVTLLGKYLTSPLQSLNQASKEIASGSYKQRVNISTSYNEIEELGTSFNAMAEAVEEKVNALKLSNKQKDDFVNSFSHEVKTPMTTIIGYADLLHQGTYSKEIENKAINYIHREAIRLEELAHKLLHLMSLTTEGITFTPITLSSLVTQAAESINITLETEGIEDVKVIGDQTLLYALFSNLLENAKKAQIDNPKAKVVVTPGLQGRWDIVIIDKGCGIPKQDVTRVTEEFYMVNKSRSRKEKRTGLGLSICKKILQLHQSDLHIESKLNVGTSVSFSLEGNNDEKEC